MNQENTTLLTKLAIRLGTHSHELQGQPPQLLVGEIPSDLPVPVIFPPSSLLLGTLITNPQSAQILLDVPSSQQEVWEFYQHALKDKGWEAPEDFHGTRRGGFVHSSFHQMSYNHFTHASGWSLNTQLIAFEPTLTGVRLHLHVDKVAQSARKRQHRMMGPDFEQILPALYPPANTHQQGGGGGGSSDQIHTNATLELYKDISIAQLAQHYTEQLHHAGWTSVDAETTEHSAWNTWSFIDKDGDTWLAAFHLFPLAGDKKHYQLGLRADLQDTNPSKKGSFVSGYSSMSISSNSSFHTKEDA